MILLKKLAASVQAKLVAALPIAMILGFLFGYAFKASWLKDAILPLTFAMVFPMMVTFDITKLFSKSHLRLHIVTQALNFGLFPFLAFALGRFAFPGNAELQLGFLLMALLPTSGMTVSWTGLSKGNVPEAVRMTVIGLILGSLATPVYMKFLMGAQIDLPFGETTFQILTVVGLPLVLGQLLRTALVRSIGSAAFEKDWKPVFPGISTLAVLLMVFSALALKAKTLLSDPIMLWRTFWPVAVFYAMNFTVSTLVARRFFKQAEAYALVYGTVMRNLSLALALALGLTGGSGGMAALVVTWAYILQVQGAAWYVKIAPRFMTARTGGRNGDSPGAESRATDWAPVGDQAPIAVPAGLMKNTR